MHTQKKGSVLILHRRTKSTNWIQIKSISPLSLLRKKLKKLVILILKIFTLFKLTQFTNCFFFPSRTWLSFYGLLRKHRATTMSKVINQKEYTRQLQKSVQLKGKCSIKSLQCLGWEMCFVCLGKCIESYLLLSYQSWVDIFEVQIF